MGMGEMEEQGGGGLDKKVTHILTNEIMENRLGKNRILNHITKEALKFPGKFGQLSLGDSCKVYRAMN